MSESNKRNKKALPWQDWQRELPTTTAKPGEMKEYKELEDDNFHRAMHAGIRDRVWEACTSITTDKSAILLPGGKESDFQLYDTDVSSCEFRQEQYFRYIFGINEPECMGVLDLAKKEAVLFVPYILDAWERWNGDRRPLEYYKDKYGMDAVYHTRDLEQVLADRGLSQLYLNYGQNTDSDSFCDLSAVEALEGVKAGKYELNKEALHPILTALRVIKTEKEILFMRRAAYVSSQAHVYVMRHVKPGLFELQLEAMFKAWTNYFGASRHTAYTCICGTGPHGAILHYGHAGRPNDRLLADGDTCLLDMGGEYKGYASDITRSYPVNGKFTKDQKDVYDAVYNAHQTVMKNMKPGVSYVDMHQLAERQILTKLLEMGILTGATVDELMAVHMGAVFMPHGLGHHIGLAVHDVGGYLPDDPKRPTIPGPCYLRTACVLRENMVITVEPGCYFNDSTLGRALANEAQAKYIDTKVLERFRGTGGMRLEDDVLVTATGCESFSVIPLTTEEVEAVMGESRTVQ